MKKHYTWEILNRERSFCVGFSALSKALTKQVDFNSTLKNTDPPGDFKNYHEINEHTNKFYSKLFKNNNDKCKLSINDFLRDLNLNDDELKPLKTPDEMIPDLGKKSQLMKLKKVLKQQRGTPGATRFNATGEVQVIGNSQAKKFAENLEKDKKKFLAENNFSNDKSIVGGPKGEQLTCSAHINLILRSSALKKTNGTCVLWVLSNMMLTDRYRKGNYQILTKNHSCYDTEGVLHPRKKKNGEKWTKNNKGYVSGLRLMPSNGWLLSSSIHTLNARAWTANELGELLADLLSRVSKLIQQGKSILIVGPMPRHPEKCCLNMDHHMQAGYSPDEFTRMCYLVSTYMVGILQQKNATVLHPGEIFGWSEKPDVMRFVGIYGVHLIDEGKRAVRVIIQRRVHANKVEREKAEVAGSLGTGDGPESTAEGGAKATEGLQLCQIH